MLIRIIGYLKMPLTKKPVKVIRKVIRKGPRALAQTGISPKPLSPHPEQLAYEDENPVRYRYQLKSFKGKIIDPIALACWMHEHGKKDGRIFYVQWHGDRKKFLKEDPYNKNNILESLKPKYYKTAQKIRDYYSQKFLMLGMGAKELTKFRTQLMRYFLDSKENYEYTEDQVGMLVTLPRMYKEDKLLDKLRENYNVSVWQQKESNSTVVRKTLYYIDVNRKKNWDRYGNGRRQDEFFNYWFHDENDRLYCIDLEIANPFCHIWSRLIEFPLEIEGKVCQNSNRDNLNYYTFGSWEILEEF